ncbi:nucleoside-diphosphate sugar epimerase/dehydratase [Halorhodospira halophila]|uniref:nucleoside-diphosphate sugar epimerase/dehydratase n=1 Tax=Halorhodospira halophila TaxID=1053 RepID=UPI001911472F|nr:hypothetical protein [Halorhodospira halophila]MBK5944740.1 hypothetical protein [Halorhodospira halophila]
MLRRYRGQPWRFTVPAVTGALLAEALRAGRRLRPVAFIDEDPGRTRARIDRLPVYPVQHLGRALSRHWIDRVVLALPSAPDVHRRRIVDQLQACGVRIDTVPAIDELLAGRRCLTQLEPATRHAGVGAIACPERLRADLDGAHVAVTGAGEKRCGPRSPRSPARRWTRGVRALGQAVRDRDARRAWRLLAELVPEYEPVGRGKGAVRPLRALEQVS